MLGRRVVDHELPGEPEPAGRRLPAQTGRDRLVGDAAAGDDRLLGGSAAAAKDAQVHRVGQVKPLGRGLDCLGRPELLGAGGARSEVPDEGAAGEDDPAVGGDVDGGVPAEDLEHAIPLVQVHVRDAAVRASVGARDEEVGDVGTCRAELRRVLPHVAQRDADGIGICRCRGLASAV